jgi:hypothetical protein
LRGGVRPEKIEGECEVCGQEAEASDVEDASCAEEGEIQGEAEYPMWKATVRISADRGLKEVRRLIDPRKPSQAEVDLHELHHLPYRNWCPHCVRGQGKDLDHRRSAGGERGLSEYHFDYCFPGDEFGFKLTILVGRERVGGMCMATVVPTKGTNGCFELHKILEFIRQCGDEATDITIKTDQEPAIKFVVEEIVKARQKDRTHLEESPVGSSGSNGVVERKVQGIEGQLRTMLSALEGRLGVGIDAKEKVVVFMAEYAAYLQCRLEVGLDGKTAYERTKGKASKILGVEFGEKLLVKRKIKSGKMEKLKPKWDYGIFVGVRPRSGEVIIATPTGITKARSVRRIPIEDRWTMDTLKWVKHVPWHRFDSDPEADGELPEDVDREPAPATTMGGQHQKIVIVSTKEAKPRGLYVTEKNVNEHGPTRGCGGCTSLLRRTGRQPHNEVCRERFNILLKDQAKVRNAERRKRSVQEDAAVWEEQESPVEKKKTKMEPDTSGSSDDHLKRGIKRSGDDIIEFESKVKREWGEPGQDEPHPLKWWDTGQNMEQDDDDVEISQVELIEHIGEIWKKVGGEDLEKWVSEIMMDMEERDEDEQMKIVMAEEDYEIAWDDVHGGEIAVKDLRKARKEEVDFMVKRKIWTEVPMSACWEKSGKAPVSVRWVDVNKGTQEDPEIRCRLVARDFKGKHDKDREDLFAATPPLEAKRALFSRAATTRRRQRCRKLLFIDARKAHLNPKCTEDVFVALPDEAGVPSGVCGKLNFWLYGFRPAASAWEKHYSELLEGVGFERGKASPVVFYHPQWDIACVVHGDDFTFEGDDACLDWIQEKMASWFDIKVRGRLGPDAKDKKEIIILGRIVRWEPWGISYRADPKHRKLIAEYFGLDANSRKLTTNGSKDEGISTTSRGNIHYLEEELGNDEKTSFRAVAARLNYLAADCPDVQFPAKEVCRNMANPTIGAFRKLKKAARYLLSREAVQFNFRWQDEGAQLKIFTDSDWAGCTRSRKSTSGGVIMLGSHCLKTWCLTQGAIALSSAEAEYYAMVEGATRGIGVKTMLKEIGMKAEITLSTDSSAAKSLGSRRGTGRIRHLETKWLWLQIEVAEGRIKLEKVAGDLNPADLLTKYKNAAEIEKLLRLMSMSTCVSAAGK